MIHFLIIVSQILNVKKTIGARFNFNRTRAIICGKRLDVDYPSIEKRAWTGGAEIRWGEETFNLNKLIKFLEALISKDVEKNVSDPESPRKSVTG
ncbi:MAG: hypothetical protein WC742_04530 [Gallionellaceae bacterium]|jgi:hypothetical protein